MAREVAGVDWEDGPGGLPFLAVKTDRCRARLTPYGAHVCEWTPAGQTAPVLFLSPRATFAAGKAIRGGVPICFPWFGNHPTDATKPAHGFARTRMWDVGEIAHDAGGDVRIVLHLASDAETRRHWDAEFAASVTMTLGAALAITFDVENTGAADLTYEDALHTYFAVSDVATIAIHGLERTQFLNKVDGMKTMTAGNEPITIAGEIDRIYLDTSAMCTVDDPGLRRKIRIAKDGSLATVVWNPGAAKAALVADIGDAWRHFVCVETANCGPHAVRLAPGAHHATTARIDVVAAV